MKVRALLAAVAVVTLSFTAPAHSAGLSIGIAYDIGGRGDRSFNDAAAVGLEKAQKQFQFSVEPVVTDGSSADRERRIRSLITKNCNPIIAVGAGYASTLQTLAVEFPNTQFAILNDGSISALNVTSLVFADTQGAYLAGYSAALVSKSGKVAMVAMPSQADIYQNGFLAGVLASKRTVSSMVKYVSGSTVIAAKQAMDQGADVIFIARPGSNSEVFSAIVSRNATQSKKKNFKAVGMISIEPDQYLSLSSSTRKYLYATVVKHVDRAMYDLISHVASGKEYLDVLDSDAGIYGHRYTVLSGGITFTTYLPALTSASGLINKAAGQASRLAD